VPRVQSQYSADDMNNRTCFNCDDGHTGDSNATFGETFGTPTFNPAGVLAARSAFQDHIEEEEKEAVERMSAAEPHNNTSEVTHRRRGPREPVLNHGGTSLIEIERREFGERHGISVSNWKRRPHKHMRMIMKHWRPPDIAVFLERTAVLIAVAPPVTAMLYQSMRMAIKSGGCLTILCRYKR
jgi:hypothetical protein